MAIRHALCFDDVLVIPQYSDICSRKEVSLETNLSPHYELDIPIISSPMDTVTESSMAAAMSHLGGLGIIHRYNSIAEQAQLVSEAVGMTKRDHAPNVGFAVGVGEDAIDRAMACVSAGANVICVDIAHGYHSLMRYTLETLRRTLGTSIHIMAGNVATAEAHQALSDWGADSVRVGIGGGSICSTRVKTGHGMPTFQSVYDCAVNGGDAAIIADGGIRNSGDVVKSIAAGADAVMIGSLLAGTTEAPGEVTTVDGEDVKMYRGMASKDAQLQWRGHYSSVEGVTSHVKSSGHVENVVLDLTRGLKSGLSYSGCRKISEFHSKCDIIQQTALGNTESGTHILNRG